MATSLIFPDQIKGINVERIKGTKSLKNILGYSDMTNNKIKTIYFPRNLKFIGQSVFRKFAMLSSITLPNTLETIGGGAFEDCTTLTSITLPNSLEFVGMRAFSNCASLTSAKLSNKLTSLAVGMFSGCKSLTSVTMPTPNLIKQIGYDAFSGCGELTSVTLPTSIEEIGRNAFASCGKLVVTLNRSFLTPKRIRVNPTVYTFGNVKKIRVPGRSLFFYKNIYPWSLWRDKIEPMSAKKLAFKRLITYKPLVNKEDILAQVTELSGGTLEKGYAIKSISNIRAISGGSGLVEALSGLSIKIKKREGVFTADLVLDTPGYLDATLTGAIFEKEKAFIFDKNTGTISGVTARYKTYFSTATSVAFPDQIEGVDVREIRGDSANKKNVFGGVNSTIKKIRFPKNLRTIAAYAFTECSGIIFCSDT